MQRPQPPKVEIFYELEFGSEKQRRQLPFVLGILSDLAGHASAPPPRLRDRKFITVDADNFDSFMSRVAPRLAYSVENRMAPDAGKLAVELHFRQMEDFAPLAVLLQIPALRTLHDLRTRLNDLHATVHANSRLDDLIKHAIISRAGEANPESPDTLVAQLIEQGYFGRYAEDTANAAECLRALFRLLDERNIVLSPTTGAMLSEHMARIDELLSTQLNEVFHHPEFQRLEASWRGLAYLVQHTPSSPLLKLKVLCASKKEILRDLQRAPEFDQSALFRLVYEEEYGTLGGEPYAALIGDYGFDHGAEDVELLSRVSNVAASAYAPFIAAAQPAMFNLDSYRQLSMPRDLAKIFDLTEFANWHAFRKSEDSSHVALVLPQVLQRLPYGRNGLAAEGFDYQEGVDGADPTKYLWGNAVYAFAARLTNAFARNGWCAAFRGMEHGGLVPDLPLQRFLSDDGETVVTCPTEIAINDRRCEELRRLGFIALCHEKGTGRAVFFETPSCHKPRLYDNYSRILAEADFARLEVIFAVSRFSQYIRAITRDKWGHSFSRREWEHYLNEWLAGYILLDHTLEQDVKARYPLAEGSISLVEIPGLPGQYRAILTMRPNYQLHTESSIEQNVDRLDLRPKGNQYGR